MSFNPLGFSFRAPPARNFTDLVPGRLPLVAVKELAPLFNEHLGAHAVLSLQYQKQAWVSAEVPHGFSAAVRMCHEEVRLLLEPVTETIVSLGAVPVSGPQLFTFSYLEHEDEHVYSPQVMLALDLSHERMVASRVDVTLSAALDHQDKPGELLLKKMLASSQGRAARLQALLERFS